MILNGLKSGSEGMIGFEWDRRIRNDGLAKLGLASALKVDEGAQGGWGGVNEGCGQDDDRDGAEQGGEQGGEQGERGERGGQSGGRGRLVGSKIRKTVKV